MTYIIEEFDGKFTIKKEVEVSIGPLWWSKVEREYVTVNIFGGHLMAPFNSLVDAIEKVKSMNSKPIIHRLDEKFNEVIE